MTRYSQILLLLIFLPILLLAQEHESLNNIIKTYEAFEYAQNDKLWPDYSEQVIVKKIEFLKGVKSRLDSLAESELSITDLANKELLELIVEDDRFNLSYGSYLFPLNSEGGFFTSIFYRVRGRKVQTERDFNRYQRTLQQLGTYISERQEHLKKGLIENKLMPKLIVKNCLRLVDETLEKGPFDSYFMNPVKGNPEWENEILLTLKKQVFPKYESMRTFLREEYLPAAPESVGVSYMADGKAYYEQRVRFFTTYDISPQEVFDTGMQEVKRIRQEMETIIQELKFRGSFKDFLEFLRTDSQFYASSAEELLKEAAWITKRMEAKLPKYFNYLPRMPLAVEPVPAELAPNYTGGRYSPGSYSNQKPGEFWVNTYDLPSRPLYVLPALALHEGVPGHHTQMMLASEMENKPRFRRNTYLSAFGEGWALYAEFLGKEAGIYQDAYEDFGRLTYEMWRACRLVVDPGMHYFGWTRSKAVQFMLDHTALSIREVNSEIDRYIGWPGQAVSYKMGELKIRALRKKAEQKIGPTFDIREFHDLVLSQGSITMKTLEKMVDNYIESK